MALSAPAPYYQPPPGLVRYRAKPRAQQLASSRYSGDFDMMMGGRAAHGDRRHPVNNVFRRAKSTEWDRDVLANNVQDRLRLGAHTLTDFHLGNSASNMQTLDKRISASTDQLDCIREAIREGGRPGGGRQFRQQRLPDKHQDKHLDRLGSGGGQGRGSEYYLGKSDNFLNRDRSGGRKTPFEIFLEDDGPYSRKLYGPVAQQGGCDSTKTKAGLAAAAADKVTTSSRNISSSKSTEYLDNTSDFVERDLRSISAIKKGLLWQQRDKLFSRWKERFFILTNDYFHCFKKGSFKVTEMGEFIFKVKLSSISSVTLLDKRGFLTICLSLGSVREGRIYLRRAEGLRDWFQLLKFTVDQRKARPAPGHPSYLADKATLGGRKRSEDEAPDPGHIRDNQTTNLPKGINRLSLVTDLLMSEAVRYYTRDSRDIGPRDTRIRKETSEDSGVESGHSMENNGTDSQTDSGSEHSCHDKDAAEEAGVVTVTVGGDAPGKTEEKLLVCHL